MLSLIRKSVPNLRKPLLRVSLCTQSPSNKTTALLQRLPLSATEGMLTEAVADLKCRRVELEPGCAVHLLSEAQAEHAASSLKAAGYEVFTRIILPIFCLTALVYTIIDI